MQKLVIKLSSHDHNTSYGNEPILATNCYCWCFTDGSIYFMGFVCSVSDHVSFLAFQMNSVIIHVIIIQGTKQDHLSHHKGVSKLTPCKRSQKKVHCFSWLFQCCTLWKLDYLFGIIFTQTLPYRYMHVQSPLALDCHIVYALVNCNWYTKGVRWHKKSFWPNY